MPYENLVRNKIHSFGILMVVLINACTQPAKLKTVSYSTESDSTRYYYQLGWHQIMDFGDYSAAEVSYRKALTFDNNFLVGQSVLARLTTDLDERLAIYSLLESKKSSIDGDERLILDVYIALVKYTNLRDQQASESKSALQEALAKSEKNLGQVVSRYPDEVYLKSEYIEVMHALYGAQTALDTIKSLVGPFQQSNAFILGYKAILTAETENYPEALAYANQLAAQLKDVKVARPDAVLANIYFQMKAYKKAKIHADRANRIDPNNLDASRLKVKLDSIVNN